MAFYSRLTEEQAIPCPNCGQPILTEKFCSSCGTANPIDYIDESVRVSKRRRVDSNRHRNPVPKRVIFLGAGAAVAVLLVSMYGSSYAVNNMQFKIIEVSDFDFASLSSNAKLEACNPTAFPGGFERFDAVVHYRDGEFARLSVEGGPLMPYESSSFDGKLKLSAQTVSGLVIALASAVGGNGNNNEDGQIKYNEEDITLTMTVDAKLLGIVPFSQKQEFTFSEFQQFMGAQKSDTYHC